MATNQPPAKWRIIKEVYDDLSETTSLWFQLHEKGLIHVVDKTIVEQLQSEAVENFKKDHDRLAEITHENIRQETRADERKKIFDEMKILVHPKMHNDVHYIMGCLTRVCGQSPSKKELEQPVSANKNNTGIFFSSPVEERK